MTTNPRYLGRNRPHPWPYVQQSNPVKREVVRTFEDINGIKHSSYADAYKASVCAKLVTLLCENKFLSHGEVADAIMKEMVVAWG